MSKSPCLNNDGTAKRTYKSRPSAVRAARRTNHDKHADMPVAPYLCPASRPTHFHVGHPRER